MLVQDRSLSASLSGQAMLGQEISGYARLGQVRSG